MFTGLVQTLGSVRRLTPAGAASQLVIEAHGLPGPVRPGDSVCVSGVCLTAVEIQGETIRFDVVAETLQRSTLGRLREGDRVNLECSVTPQQPLGGHFMQGHVDGVGTVRQVVEADGQWRTTIEPPAELMPSIIPKGSIAVDGVSLTVASVAADRFDVALIPETLERTTLRSARAGVAVNLEADILSKTVVQWLERTTGRQAMSQDAGVTMQLLRDAGFAS